MLVDIKLFEARLLKFCTLISLVYFEEQKL